MAKNRKIPEAHATAIQEAQQIIARHSLFGSLPGAIQIAGADAQFARDGYARIDIEHQNFSRPPREHRFTIALNGFQRASAGEWANIIAQCRLHVVLNHCDPDSGDEAWRIACELEAMDLLRHLGIGQRPASLPYSEVALPGRKPQDVAAFIRTGGAEAVALFSGHGTAGTGQKGWVAASGTEPLSAKTRKAHTEIFAKAIRNNVAQAVDAAGDAARGGGPAKSTPNSLAQRSRRWFVANYPLLAALAACFDIIEDAGVCDQLQIAIAAVHSESRQIYINPRYPWTRPIMDFVMAHELLHVGLRHEERRQGRDAFLWNIACDYVINGWLVEMGVGTMPNDGLMLDPELELEKDSCEAVYDRIVKDLRLLRRLGKARTLRGIGAVDMIGDRPSRWWSGPGTDLDSFYRRALGDGLDLHLRSGARGTLPGSLVDEINAIQHKAVPWDVRLGQWLDAYFPPLESRRSFARASRRQGSTPDIPRAVYIRPRDLMASRTFGVVLDTSGSMSAKLLAYALGAIASYALSREVPLVRVVQCDAGAHDMGYVAPEALAGRVEVRGRGGTVLMPGIELLQQSPTFPKDAPILVITDGFCDTLTVQREHAYVMPEGGRLPFATRSPVFHFEREG